MFALSFEYQLLIIVLIVSILFTLFVGNEGFTNYFVPKVFGFNLGFPTKCVDCENQLPEQMKYMGGRTKCFSCERQYAQMFGPQYANLGQPNKCFDCERQMMTGSTCK